MSTINDYLVEYHFGDPEKIEAYHFTLDGILDLAKKGAYINRIESIKNEHSRPVDVTEKTLKFVRSKNAKR